MRVWSLGWSVVAAICLCGLAPDPGQAIFLAPCLWRQTRSVVPPPAVPPAAVPSPAVPPAAVPPPSLLRTRRFLSTDADACTNLCRIPLFPSPVCQRCCAAAGLPVPPVATTGGLGLLGNLGLTGTGTGAQSLAQLPLVPLAQLQALVNQLLASGYLTIGSLQAIVNGGRPAPAGTSAGPPAPTAPTPSTTTTTSSTTTTTTASTPTTTRSTTAVPTN